MRLIDADVLKEELTSHFDLELEPVIEKEVLRMIDEQETISVASPKWISVKDKLPNDGRFLVLLRSSLHKAGKNYLMEIATFSGGKFYLYVSYREGMTGDLMTVPYRIDNVTHWMPLPEPPEAKDVR